ncbi:DNA polymerase I [Pseudohongiella sp. SYSU M77423]|uniref:DNA polymerase I n=1 Tax=Pseudohongiella sp. SYSU M77423 TaxID=3042312 RepID=UPI0024800518|nr:DNA polymerase I [Pseudohongiella sp. SYSU M77423]MDH7944228.1 DNA polymerase I [Pseudohongiella sp. SYSU M77423]
MTSVSPLILIDGSSYLFRAYHALPPLVSSKGQPTGAIKGVISMIRSLQKEYPESPIAVVFDAKGDTFRNEIYKEYKAHRPPMPDELRSQIEPIHHIIKAMGLPLLVIPDVEADDVIGTLACQATTQRRETLVSTGDKDLAQLVSDHVTLINTMTNERLDIEGVNKKFSLPPERIVDFLALTGDKVDNIPGVPGVGPKTAVKWLQEYGSMDAIIENADKIGGKIGEKLRDNIEQLRLSYELATIKLDVSLDISISELIPEEPDQTQLMALFSEFEFKTWTKELESQGVEVSSEQLAAVREDLGVTDPVENDGPDLSELETSRQDYELLADTEALKSTIGAIKSAGQFAVAALFDANEHFMSAQVIGLAFSWEPGQAVYLPLAHDSLESASNLDRRECLQLLKPVLQDPSIHKVAHDSKRLAHLMQNHDIAVRGWRFDTHLASYVLNSVANNHSLEDVSHYYLQQSLKSLDALLGSGRNKLPVSQCDPQAALDWLAPRADMTFRLRHKLQAVLESTGELWGLYRYFELALSPVLQRMERTGIAVDPERLHEQSAALSERLAELEEQVYKEAGETFNLGSPKQLQTVLYEKMNLPVLKKTPKGQPSTAEAVLQELALEYDLPNMIMEHRGLSKLKSTYTEKLPLQINRSTRRIHSTFQQAVAATGRLSSTEPNLQNIPIRSTEGRKIRQAFIAAPGYRLVAADYSQVELRIMAHLSQDKGLVTAFANAQDVHRATAAEVFGVSVDDVTGEQRRRAKAINFGLIYGMSAFGLARQLGIDRHDAQLYVDRYFERYPGVLEYMERTRELAEEKGYVETLFGRRLYLPDIKAGNGMLRKAAQRTAINAPMQGTAADIIKQAMVDIDHWLQTGVLDARLVLQVHDELIFEVAEADVDLLTEGVRFRMVSAASLDVPLVVDVGVGENWDQAH